jgi:3-isopropylmalate/(R)-2-methylmalate dehydratase small subunit
LFFRNAFNLGLLLLTCAEAEQLQEGDTVTLLPTGVQGPDGRVLPCNPIPDFLMDMVHAGGLMNVLKQRSQGNKP